MIYSVVMNIWRKYISKPRLGNYVSADSEVCYSHYGPTFAIAGTLTALNTVLLIHNICVEILNTDNKAYHFMDWFAFRPVQNTMGNFSELDLTMASKFTITPEQAFAYNILFIDNGRFTEMKPVLKTIKDSWDEAVFISSQKNNDVNLKLLFNEFKRLNSVMEAESRLRSGGYWEPGQYRVKVHVTTDNPKQIFDADKSFVLTENDTEILAGNAEAIIANLCQQSPGNYHCATPRLTQIP